MFNLLKKYYRTESNFELFKLLIEDFKISLFLSSGSGLFLSIIKGLIGHLFIKSKLPLLIGRETTIIRPSNIVLGKYVRLKNYTSLIAYGKISIDHETLIGEYSILWSDKNRLVIGKNVTVGKYCYFAQLGGPIIIGNDVLIGDYVRIYSKDHNFDKISSLIRKQGFIDRTVIIKDNVWIGSGVTIFNNVVIGKGAIIAANSVVNKNVPPFTIYGGVPGKIIGSRYGKNGKLVD